MTLDRVGGKHDGGIDLQGWWWIPSTPSETSGSDRRRRIRVLAQCKAEKKKTSPKYVRELEGVLSRHKTQDGRDNTSPAMALFLSESTYTKATIIRAMSSHVPFLLLHMPPSDQDAEAETSAGVGSALWNDALSGTNGLLKGMFDVRWEYGSNSSDDSAGRPGLWLGDRRVENWVPSRSRSS